MFYTKEEIDFIKKKIEKWKVFYIQDNRKPFMHLFITLLGIALSIYLLTKSVYFIPLLSLFISRAFMIFHDCCHNSFFKVSEKEHNEGKRSYNKITAQLLEMFINYDEYTWTKIHGHHHSIHGNRNENDTTRTVITVDEYNSLSPIKKFLYRIIRTPIIFFLLTPIYVFFINHLIIYYYKDNKKIDKLDYAKSKIFIILKIVLFYYIIYKYGGIKLLLSIILSLYLAAIIGIMFFHLQHQVNIGYWKKFDNNNQFEYDKAQLHGSSLLKVPNIFKPFTFGIEYHHIHHITPRIPGYNLQKCHEENEKLFNKITTVGYKQAVKSLSHTLYDEKKKRYISFDLDKKLGLQH
jgi:acyl-lipid omega-6 desaturase (Delta-12 desaturase)